MDIKNLSIEELDQLAESLWRSMMTEASNSNDEIIGCVEGSVAENLNALILLSKILLARAEDPGKSPEPKGCSIGPISKYDHSDDAFSYVTRNDAPSPDALEEPVIRSRKKN